VDGIEGYPIDMGILDKWWEAWDELEETPVIVDSEVISEPPVEDEGDSQAAPPG